ncbi:MAG: hypothetical protein KAJ19_14325, partial [Gammaproteobacteria bacterium]|nr:hypothetical protein [Gammaproteobacteria bacterium]
VGYAWDFDAGDGVDFASPDQTAGEPDHTFTEPGVYTVSLKVRDLDGNSDETSLEVTVLDTTSPLAIPEGPAVVDEDAEVTFTAVNSSDNVGISVWWWDRSASDGLDWDDPDQAGETVLLSWEEPAVYTLTLRVEDGGGNNGTSTMEVEVLDVTAPTAVIEGPDSVNEDTWLTLSAVNSTDNVGITEWLWDLDDSDGVDWDDSDDEGETIDAEYEEPGVYNVTLRVEDAAGLAATAVMAITVLDTTEPDADLARLPGTVDQYGTVTLDASDSEDNVAIVSYTWSFELDGEPADEYVSFVAVDGDALDANISAPDWTLTGEPVLDAAFELPGLWRVTLTVADAADNTDTDDRTFRVLEVVVEEKPEDEVEEPVDEEEEPVDEDEEPVDGGEETDVKESSDDPDRSLMIAVVAVVALVVVLVVLLLLLGRKGPAGPPAQADLAGAAAVGGAVPPDGSAAPPDGGAMPPDVGSAPLDMGAVPPDAGGAPPDVGAASTDMSAVGAGAGAGPLTPGLPGPAAGTQALPPASPPPSEPAQ